MDAAVAAVSIKAMVTKGYLLPETIHRYVVAFTRYFIGTKGPEMCQENTPSCHYSTAAAAAGPQLLPRGGIYRCFFTVFAANLEPIFCYCIH